MASLAEFKLRHYRPPRDHDKELCYGAEMDHEPKSVTLEDAERSIHDIFARVRDGEAFSITSGGSAFAEILPAKKKTLGDLIAFFRDGPHLEPEDAEAFERDLQSIRASAAPVPYKWQD